MWRRITTPAAANSDAILCLQLRQCYGSSDTDAENYLEVVADIAFTAGNMVGRGQLEISDSRQLMSNIAMWAKDFEVAFDKDRHGDDYMELVDDYAVICLREREGEIRAFLERMLSA